MASMICNCDSYGIIDYGVPILLKNPDFRTSTGIGLRSMPPIKQTFYSVPTMIPKSTEGILEAIQGTYSTQSARTYDKKYQKWNTSGTGKKADRAENVLCMLTFKERMFKNPPVPRPYPMSVYKLEYDDKEIEEPNKTAKNIDFIASCPLSTIGKSEQPRLRIEDVGVMRRMDPYATTTNLSYIRYTKNQLDNAKKPLINFYEAKNCAELQNATKPLNDEIKFKRAIKNRIIPKTVYRVPNTGKCTEYVSNYKPPTTRCFSNLIWANGVEYPDSLSDPSGFQTLAAPNMYCTESCHVGTGWPVQGAVRTLSVEKFKQQQLRMNLKCPNKI